MNEPLSVRLRALELFADSLSGMLILGFFTWRQRPASWPGTILWCLAVIGAAMALEAVWAFWLRDAFRRSPPPFTDV